MFIKIVKWLRGCVLLVVKNKNPERFFNLCRKRNINLWNITHKESLDSSEYYFFMKLKDYWEIRPIVNKTKVRPKIIKRIGLPFLIHNNRKRYGYVCGVIISILLIYLLSLSIWDISVLGGYKYTPNIILNHLEENNIKPGTKIKKLNGFEIERNIRNTYKDIGWVSAEIKGTRLIIRIKETTMPSVAKEDLEPSHIIAQKDGEVLSIITKAGTPNVKAGDIIKKGDILVSGLVNVYSDFEEIINIKPLVADSDIRIKTDNKYKDTLNIKYRQKEYTGKSKLGISINILKLKINIYNPRISYDKYDIIVNEKKFKITNSFYLPITINTTKINEYNDLYKSYTKEEANIILNNNLTRFKEKLENEDKVLINNNIVIRYKNNEYIAEGTYILDEPAWSYKVINKNEWRLEEVDDNREVN